MNLLPPSAPQFGVNYDVGYICFLDHNGGIPHDIEWFTRWWRKPGTPSVDHVFIITGPGTLVEANGDGVDTEALSEYTQTPGNTVYFRKPKLWTPDLGVRIASAALKYKGVPYDYRLISADALSYSLLGHLVNEISGDALDSVLTDVLASNGKMICDKLAIVAMQAQPELRPLLTLPASENNPQRLFCDDDVFENDVAVVKT